LSSNLPLISAVANDIGYEDTIVFQLCRLAKQGDIVILISSSGNSPNILKAAKWAVDYGVLVIGMTGFSGGKLKELSDISLHVPIKNYGVVEDCHQSLMHIIAQFIHDERWA
jgi:D-sedoheptulose 7-phosphate isomerase